MKTRTVLSIALCIVLTLCLSTAFAEKTPANMKVESLEESFEYDYINVELLGSIVRPDADKMPLCKVSLKRPSDEAVSYAAELFMGAAVETSENEDTDGNIFIEEEVEEGHSLEFFYDEHGMSFMSLYRESSNSEIIYNDDGDYTGFYMSTLSSQASSQIPVEEGTADDIIADAMNKLTPVIGGEDYREMRTHAENNDNMSVCMELERYINGIPVSADLLRAHTYYIEEDITTYNNPRMVPEYGPYSQESVSFEVDGAGDFLYFDWNDPLSIDEYEEVVTISYEEALDIFRDNVNYYRWSVPEDVADENGGNYLDTLTITEVRLSLMRVRQGDDLEQFLIVPVWDFIGCASNSKMEEEVIKETYAYSYFTVNAIDGIPVDRYMGY